MKKPDRQSKTRSPVLSDEDLMLWQHTTRAMRPLHGGKKRIPPVTFDEAGYQPHVSQETRQQQAQPSEPATPRIPAARRSQDHARRSPALAEFDTRKARKIKAGRIEIQARLDLHGMRQSEAHSALQTFLLRAHARRLKWVLVITGKGTFARDGESPAPFGGDWSAPQRGVLRHNVPKWLAEPQLRSVVVSYTTAAVHHGGEGALYIQLRSAKK
jgi:DNA-nicking Smr family endonuclease